MHSPSTPSLLQLLRVPVLHCCRSHETNWTTSRDSKLVYINSACFRPSVVLSREKTPGEQTPPPNVGSLSNEDSVTPFRPHLRAMRHRALRMKSCNTSLIPQSDPRVPLSRWLQPTLSRPRPHSTTPTGSLLEIVLA